MIGLPYNQGLYYCTYKPIAAGSELLASYAIKAKMSWFFHRVYGSLVWYGQDYGECLKIPGVEHSLAKKAPWRLPPKHKKRNYGCDKLL
uniref:Uncharacterized protein n=1 Tax=Romanomermis culicivorax TaxID=13658 RepID=A0A915JGX9_ROMCU